MAKAPPTRMSVVSAGREVHVYDYVLDDDEEADWTDDDGEEHMGGCRWWLLRRLQCDSEPDTSDRVHHWNPPKLPGENDRVSDWNDIDWSLVKDFYTGNNSCEYNLGPEDELPFHKFKSQIKTQHDFIKQQVEAFKEAGYRPDSVFARKRVLNSPGFRSLEKQWSELTPQEFVRSFVALEAFQQQKEYLDSLAIPVDSETLHQFQVIPKCWQKQFSGVAVHVIRTDKLWSEEGHDPDFSVHFAGRGFVRSPFRAFYRFAYSSAGKIFSGDCQSNAYIVKALLEAGPDSGVFLSVVGRALEDSIWSDCFYGFMCSRFIDACHLSALAMVGFRLRQDRTMWWTSYFVLWFCWWKSLTMQFLEIAMIMRQYGVRHLFDKWITPWNVTMFPVEAFSLTSAFVFLMQSMPNDDPAAEPVFQQKHPVWLSFVCGAKWFEFLMSLLCIRPLGLNVLPAVNAMFSKESLWFLVFVIACVGANFGDYYMFPIPENYQYTNGTNTNWKAMFAREGWYEFVFGVMKIFRLDIMGDFNIWELEGLDEEVKTTGAWGSNRVSNNTEVAYLDEPHVKAPFTDWHYGIRFFFMTSCIIIHLMLLNVYIGLLTKTYERKAAQKRQLLAEFRMVFALRQLLCRIPVARLQSAFRSWLPSRLTSWLGIAPSGRKAGVWISYDPKLFRSESYGWVGKGPVSDPEDMERLHFY